jgi:hypothetical protein
MLCCVLLRMRLNTEIVVIVVLLQISSAFVKLFSVAFPPVVLRYFAALSFINMSIVDLFSFGCVFQSTFYVNLVSARAALLYCDV